MTKDPEKQQGTEEDSISRMAGEGYTLALNLVVSTLVGLGIGLALDKWLGTIPLFLLLFMVLGFAAGIRTMILKTKMD